MYRSLRFLGKKLYQYIVPSFVPFLLLCSIENSFAQEFQSQDKLHTYPCKSGSKSILTRLHNIDLMHHVLRKDGYQGYDVIIISSTTKEEADYQQQVLEKAFAGTTKHDGKAPLILSVVDTTEGGQIIGAIFTWLKAEEKMRNKHAQLIREYGTLLDFVRATKSKIAVYHNGGRGERCSPLTQSLGNSRGAQKLVGSVMNAQGEEIELEVLLAVVLQCSSFATTNNGTHLDTFWTSQIAFGSHPHDQLERSNFAIDKFLVGFDRDDLIPQNIADFGTAALSKTGRMMAFYGNKRFASRKGDQYVIDKTKIEAELLSKGDRFAYDFGSFSSSLDMWQLLLDYWQKKNIFPDMLAKEERSKIKRDIDPHFIQPLIRLLYGINDLADRHSIDQHLPKSADLKMQIDLDNGRELFEAILNERFPHVHAYIWEDINQEKDAKKKAEAIICMNEVIEFYLLYRQRPSFAELTKIFGYIDLGNDTQWFRYRRPIDIMNEKFEMLTDLIGKKIEVQLNGFIQESAANDELIQRCCEARFMRGIPTKDILKFKVEGKPVTLTFAENQAGKVIEGVYIKNSIIQQSDLTKGSSLINSVANNVFGKVIAKDAYLESSSAPLIEAVASVVHEVMDTNSIVADREVVSDVYRTQLTPAYHGRMRAPIGYDPKGMSIYKITGKGENGKPIYGDELDETICYFVERIPYDLNQAKEYGDETARTEDGRFTFEEIRRIEPHRIADKEFRESVNRTAKQAVMKSRQTASQ